MSGNQMNPSLSNSENYSSENEEGGFHDSKIGDTFKNSQYRVVNLLGKGTFSQVWLIEDTVTHQHLAMKISSSKRSQIEAAEDEIEILMYVNYKISKLKESKHSEAWKEMQTELNCKNNHVVEIVDHFLHVGQQGSHQCSTLEILGPTLLDIIEYYDSQNKKMSIELVKHIVKQILIGLCYIHDICQVIHTDIKPENIMIKLDPLQEVSLIEKLTCDQIVEPKVQKKVKVNENCDIFTWQDAVAIKLDKSLSIKIVDFGNACFEDQQFEEIQTREYKSPESLLQANYYFNTDIWSLACVTFELLTNNYLFRPSGENEIVKVEDHLAMIIETIGPISKQVLRNGKRSKLFFNSEGKLRSFDDLEYMALSKILVNEYSIEEKDAIEIEEFLVFLLRWDPVIRPSAKQVLQHKWLNN